MEYSRASLRIVVAQICQTLGWTSIHTTPLELLSDILERYLLQLGRSVHRYSEQFGRTVPNIDDLFLTLTDHNIKLEELHEYISYIDPVAFPYDPPPLYPIAKNDDLNFPTDYSSELQERKENEKFQHVDMHLPLMFPDSIEKDQSIKDSSVSESISSAPAAQDVIVSSQVCSSQSSAQASGVLASTSALSSEKPSISTLDSSPSFKKQKLNSEGLPEEAGPSQYTMTGVVMANSGFLTPTRGQGKLADPRTPPAPTPSLITDTPFQPPAQLSAGVTSTPLPLFNTPNSCTSDQDIDSFASLSDSAAELDYFVTDESAYSDPELPPRPVDSPDKEIVEDTTPVVETKPKAVKKPPAASSTKRKPTTRAKSVRKKINKLRGKKKLPLTVENVEALTETKESDEKVSPKKNASSFSPTSINKFEKNKKSSTRVNRSDSMSTTSYDNNESPSTRIESLSEIFTHDQNVDILNETDAEQESRLSQYVETIDSVVHGISSNTSGSDLTTTDCLIASKLSKSPDNILNMSIDEVIDDVVKRSVDMGIDTPACSPHITEPRSVSPPVDNITAQSVSDTIVEDSTIDQTIDDVINMCRSVDSEQTNNDHALANKVSQYKSEMSDHSIEDNSSDNGLDQFNNNETDHFPDESNDPSFYLDQSGAEEHSVMNALPESHEDNESEKSDDTRGYESTHENTEGAADTSPRSSIAPTSPIDEHESTVSTDDNSTELKYSQTDCLSAQLQASKLQSAGLFTTSHVLANNSIDETIENVIRQGTSINDENLIDNEPVVSVPNDTSLPASMTPSPCGTDPYTHSGDEQHETSRDLNILSPTRAHTKDPSACVDEPVFPSVTVTEPCIQSPTAVFLSSVASAGALQSSDQHPFEPKISEPSLLDLSHKSAKSFGKDSNKSKIPHESESDEFNSFSPKAITTFASKSPNKFDGDQKSPQYEVPPRQESIKSPLSPVTSPTWPKVSLNRLTPEDLKERFDFSPEGKITSLPSTSYKSPIPVQISNVPPNTSSTISQNEQPKPIQPLCIEFGKKSDSELTFKIKKSDIVSSEKHKKNKKKKKNKDKDKDKSEKKKSKDKKDKEKREKKENNSDEQDSILQTEVKLIPKLRFKFGSIGGATTMVSVDTADSSSTVQNVASISPGSSTPLHGSPSHVLNETSSAISTSPSYQHLKSSTSFPQNTTHNLPPSLPTPGIFEFSNNRNVPEPIISNDSVHKSTLAAEKQNTSMVLDSLLPRQKQIQRSSSISCSTRKPRFPTENLERKDESPRITNDDSKVWICPTCRLPDDGSPMIGCDTCDDWYHWPCVGITAEPAETDQWFCPSCLASRMRKKTAPKSRAKGKKSRIR